MSPRCVAFGTTTGRICVLEADHGGPHILEGEDEGRPTLQDVERFRAEWAQLVNTFAPCRSGVVQEFVERLLAAMSGALS